MQQINLYTFLPKKKTKFGFTLSLTKKNVLMSYGAFALLLLAFYGIKLSQKHKLTLQMANLTNQVTLQQQVLAALMKQYPMSDTASLTKTLLQLKKDYEIKATLLDLLSPNADFSNYLLGLANATVSGVWLTEITFDRGETKIALKGYTLQPALLEQFYSRLTNQPIFSNLIFKLNEIKQTNFPASFFITAKKVNTV